MRTQCKSEPRKWQDCLSAGKVSYSRKLVTAQMSYCQIWFSECGLCQVGNLGVRPGSWFSPKSSHVRFMMAFGGRSSSDVFGEVSLRTSQFPSPTIRPNGMNASMKRYLAHCAMPVKRLRNGRRTTLAQTTFIVRSNRLVGLLSVSCRPAISISGTSSLFTWLSPCTATRRRRNSQMLP